MVQGGRYAFAADDGFRVVFRPTNRGRGFALFALASLVIIGFTLRLLLREPRFDPLAWGIAGLLDFAAIFSLHIVRRALATGRLIVDGAEARIFLSGGAEVRFDRLRSLHVVRQGAIAHLCLLHEEGMIRVGPRPVDEIERAAAAVSRIVGLPESSAPAS